MKTILTDKALRALKPAPAGKRITLWDAALAGFGVRVTDRGVISFHVMRRLPGKPHPVRVVLGQYPALSLTAARKKAGSALDDLASGVHPRERSPHRAGRRGPAQGGHRRPCGRGFHDPAPVPKAHRPASSHNCSAASWSAGGATGPSPTSAAPT